MRVKMIFALQNRKEEQWKTNKRKKIKLATIQKHDLVMLAEAIGN